MNYRNDDDYITPDLLTVELNEQKGRRRDMWITAVLVLICLMVVWTKFVWLEPIQVSGDSMNDTLVNGNMLVLDRLASPNYGDVVVFTKGGTPYIKRVIALGGDSVMIMGGNLYLKKSGQPEYVIQNEEYAKGRTYMYYYDGLSRVHTEERTVFEVKNGEFFAMGDNREGSIDCRDPRLGGAISLNYLDGVVHKFFIDHKDSPIAGLYKFL